MKKRKSIGVITIAIIVIVVFGFLVGNTAFFKNQIKEIKGELIGNNFTIYCYDDFGNPFVTLYGDKIGMEATYTEESVIDEEGNESTAYVVSSVVKITIDGHEAGQTGSTMIFEEEGLERLENFDMPEELSGNGGTINAIDRNINKLKNILGVNKIVIICSQSGVPIAVYGGEKVYTEVCTDLPKTTQFNIDGKMLYVHRADILYFDGALMENR